MSEIHIGEEFKLNSAVSLFIPGCSIGENTNQYWCGWSPKFGRPETRLKIDKASNEGRTLTAIIHGGTHTDDAAKGKACNDYLGELVFARMSVSDFQDCLQAVAEDAFLAGQKAKVAALQRIFIYNEEFTDDILS